MTSRATLGLVQKTDGAYIHRVTRRYDHELQNDVR